MVAITAGAPKMRRKHQTFGFHTGSVVLKVTCERNVKNVDINSTLWLRLACSMRLWEWKPLWHDPGGKSNVCNIIIHSTVLRPTTRQSESVPPSCVIYKRKHFEEACRSNTARKFGSQVSVRYTEITH